ncbi:ABC transporter substrate-binding protein [Microbacterium sp. NPDC055683]
MKTQRMRRLGTASVAIAAAATLVAGCAAGDGAQAGGDAELTVMAWANADEAAMYEAAFDVFEEKNPGVSVSLEYADVGSYFDKLNTKYAAGDPPDVMFLVGRNLGEYTARDALLDLDEYADVIDFDAVDQSLLEANRVDGTTYAVPTGAGAVGLAVNTAVLDEYGVALPDDRTWTWDDFAEWSQSITEASGGEVYGSLVNMGWPPTVTTFARQQGEDLYTPDGELGVSEDTMRTWFDKIVEYNETGVFAPAELADETGAFSAEQSPLGAGEIAATVIPSNQLATYSAVLDGAVTLLRLPGETEGERPGMSVTPVLLWAAAANSPHPAEAAALIDFLTNDIDSYADRAAFLGVPINPDVALELGAQLEPADQEFVEYVAALSAEELDPLYLEPAGASVVSEILTTLTTEVTYGRTTPDDAAASFMTQAADALAQAG